MSRDVPKLASVITTEPYGRCPGLVRMRIPESAGACEVIEVTCHASELATVFAWAETHAGRTHEIPLPVPEYREPKWRPAEYRWTSAADLTFAAYYARRSGRAA